VTRDGEKFKAEGGRRKAEVKSRKAEGGRRKEEGGRRRAKGEKDLLQRFYFLLPPSAFLLALRRRP